MDMLTFIFVFLIILILKYKEELINCFDVGRKVNSNFNEYNFSRICNNFKKIVKLFFFRFDFFICEWL